MDEGYEKILEKLSKISGVEKDEIDRRVEAKRSKLSGLISREGALQVIAAELGVSFDEEKLKIGELLTGMRKVNFTGKVTKLFPVRTFKTKAGEEGKVVNLVVADDTSNTKLVLWDTNHIKLIEEGKIKEGTSIEVVGGSMRQGEVHMGSFSELKLSDEKFPEVVSEKPIQEKEIDSFNVGERVSTRAFIVQSFNPNFFQANKETGRKATEEEIKNGAEVEKRAILNIVIDDGTENIRAVLFNDVAKKIGLSMVEDEERIQEEKMSFLGKEMVFHGSVRMNSYFNNPELIVEDLSEIDIDLLVGDKE